MTIVWAKKLFASFSLSNCENFLSHNLDLRASWGSFNLMSWWFYLLAPLVLFIIYRKIRGRGSFSLFLFSFFVCFDSFTFHFALVCFPIFASVLYAIPADLDLTGKGFPFLVSSLSSQLLCALCVAVVIVTGSAAGIGYYTAKTLAQRNAIVIITSRSLSRAMEAQKKLMMEGSVCLPSHVP